MKSCNDQLNLRLLIGFQLKILFQKSIERRWVSIEILNLVILRSLDLVPMNYMCALKNLPKLFGLRGLPTHQHLTLLTVGYNGLCPAGTPPEWVCWFSHLGLHDDWRLATSHGLVWGNRRATRWGHLLIPGPKNGPLKHHHGGSND